MKYKAFSVITALLALCLCAAGQTLTVTGPSGNIKAGTTVQLVVSLSGSTGLNIAALQFAIASPTFPLSCTTGNAAAGSSKVATCGIIAGTSNYGVVISGANANVISDGTVATLSFAVPPGAPAGTNTIGLTNTLGANSGGTVVTVGAGVPFSFATTNPCDLNNDGVVNATDETLAAQQAAYGAAGGLIDLNLDGVINVVDVQIVANASAPGGSCKVGK